LLSPRSSLTPAGMYSNCARWKMTTVSKAMMLSTSGSGLSYKHL
jgi:hypothetical protein